MNTIFNKVIRYVRIILIEVIDKKPIKSILKVKCSIESKDIFRNHLNAEINAEYNQANNGNEGLSLQKSKKNKKSVNINWGSHHLFASKYF